MQIALGGHRVEEPIDPLVVVPGFIDVATLPSPVTQQRLEDLQLFGFLTAVAAGGGQHPLRVDVPLKDPPDRYIRSPTTSWGIELTELTLEDVRSALAPIRAAGRMLQAALEESTEHEHLRGRIINATVLPAKFTDDPRAGVGAAVEVLKENRGSTADVSYDPISGPPERLPTEGIYGDAGPFHVIVNGPPPGIPGRITVSATTSARIRRSEAVAALEARIEAKDLPGNELLLVSCGLPDKKGYTCEVDSWIFQLLVDAFESGHGALNYAPQHLMSIAVHSLATGQWFEAYRSAGASPDPAVDAWE
jgi:hypothetical protein